MHQDHVTCRCRILDDLEPYPIDLFDALVEPRDPRSGITNSAQIAKVRVSPKGSPELRTARTGWRRILRKPTIYETM